MPPYWPGPGAPVGAGHPPGAGVPGTAGGGCWGQEPPAGPAGPGQGPGGGEFWSATVVSLHRVGRGGVRRLGPGSAPGSLPAPPLGPPDVAAR